MLSEDMIDSYPVGRFTGLLCRKPRLIMLGVFCFVAMIVSIGAWVGGGEFAWVGTDMKSIIVLRSLATRTAMYQYSGEDASYAWYDDDDPNLDANRQTVELFPTPQIISIRRKEIS